MESQFKCAFDQLINLAQLRPNPKNKNVHSAEQIERLAKIIAYQGQRSPIVVSNRSGFITKGHGRLEAIKALGWESAAVDFQDYDSEESEYSDMVADNAISLWSELDLGGINLDLQDIGPFDIDLLGLKDFTVDISEKTEKSKKQKKPIECPSCGHMIGGE